MIRLKKDRTLIPGAGQRHRKLERLRDAGNRLTGGGLRSLAKRLVGKLLHQSSGGQRVPPVIDHGPSGNNHLTTDLCASGALSRKASEQESETVDATKPKNCESPTRAQILLGPVPRKAHIIEIGPSYNPIAPKAEGWNTKTLDHTTREKLIAHYNGQPGVDVNRIEEVDFVWSGGSLVDSVPAALHGSFDAFIASHVIEHTPDLIAFLDSAMRLLKPTGVVVLAVPDKRYCFDYFQPLSTTGELLAAHKDGRSRHTRCTAFNHSAYAVNSGGGGAWGQHPTREIHFYHPIEAAQQLFDSIGTRDEYVDLHNWHFTPSSFELLLLELYWLGETDWQIERSTPARGCEFFVWLRREMAAPSKPGTEAEFNMRRLTLLKRILLEQKEQIDWLIAGEPGLTTTSPNPPSSVQREEPL